MAGLSDVKHEGCSAVLLMLGLASSFHHFSGEICSASGTKPNKVKHARVGPLPDVKSRAETNHRPSQSQPTRYRMSLQRDEGSPTGLHLDIISGLDGSVVPSTTPYCPIAAEVSSSESKCLSSRL